MQKPKGGRWLLAEKSLISMLETSRKAGVSQKILRGVSRNGAKTFHCMLKNMGLKIALFTLVC
jgi:hypothetical protein